MCGACVAARAAAAAAAAPAAAVVDIVMLLPLIGDLAVVALPVAAGSGGRKSAAFVGWRCWWATAAPAQPFGQCKQQVPTFTPNTRQAADHLRLVVELMKSAWKELRREVSPEGLSPETARRASKIRMHSSNAHLSVTGCVSLV